MSVLLKRVPRLRSSKVRKVLVSLFVIISIRMNDHVTKAEEIDLSDSYSGSCWLKAWTGVAECRKEFVDRILNKSDEEKCCLYRILEECAIQKSAKMCGLNVKNGTEVHLKKYRVMMDEPDCSRIQINSKECFWIIWDNYVTCGIFLIVVLLILGYTVRWYMIQ